MQKHLSLLSRLNLSQLDDYGYREFSDAALDLAGKMIRANPKSAKVSLALLKRVNIRDDSGDHESYLRLANSLRKQGLYKEALDEYARLGPIVQKNLPRVPLRQFLRSGRFIVMSKTMSYTFHMLLVTNATAHMPPNFSMQR